MKDYLEKNFIANEDGFCHVCKVDRRGAYAQVIDQEITMELFNLKDHNEQVSFSQAVLKGIGKDQGLFFPDHITPMNNIDELLDMPLVERSQKVLRMISA